MCVNLISSICWLSINLIKKYLASLLSPGNEFVIRCWKHVFEIVIFLVCSFFYKPSMQSQYLPMFPASQSSSGSQLWCEWQVAFASQNNAEHGCRKRHRQQSVRSQSFYLWCTDQSSWGPCNLPWSDLSLISLFDCWKSML